MPYLLHRICYWYLVCNLYVDKRDSVFFREYCNGNFGTLTVFYYCTFHILYYPFYFSGLKYFDGRPYFTDYWEAFWDLYVLVTTANDPDVM